METVMNGFEKDAAFYRAYLTDERSLGPLVGVLATLVAVWMLFYLVGAVGPEPMWNAPAQEEAEAAAVWLAYAEEARPHRVASLTPGLWRSARAVESSP
jgi:hypothetical protein